MGRSARWVGFAALAALAIWALAYWAGGWVGAYVDWVEGFGALAPVAFVVGFVAATLALIPSSILMMAAGMLFGVTWGTLYAFIGAVLSAVCAFLVARYLARSTVERHFGDDPRFDRIDRAIEERGLQVVLLLRLSPIFPFSILNYALGVTRIRFVDYCIASLGLLPPTWLFVYDGKLMGDVARVGVGRLLSGRPTDYSIVALGVLATVTLTLWLTRVTRRALR
jgi:uncharacterized membrane protein YdjX (TVP38/TMEM64 family)